VLATLGAIAVLAAIGATVATALFVDFVREHRPASQEIPPQSEVPADEALQLGQRFAPILKLHSTEPFIPISRAAYVSRTSLKEQEGKFEQLIKDKLGIDDLPAVEGTCLPVRGCLFYLDVRGAEPDPPKRVDPAYLDIQRQLVREGAHPTVYFHVTKYDDTGDYAIQYWFLYIFNFRLNEHESDWEQITVRLDADKNPVSALYSAHEGGNTRAWSELQKDGEHPIVYPALGSHANYFTPGRHRVQVGCKRVIGSIKQCFRGRKILVDVADGEGRRLDPDAYDLTQFSGPVFVGNYGTGNYVILTRRPAGFRDPRLRLAWADPLRDLR
jgi:VPS62-like protein